MEGNCWEVLTPEMEAVTGGTLGDLFGDDWECSMHGKKNVPVPGGLAQVGSVPQYLFVLFQAHTETHLPTPLHWWGYVPAR